eukprot:CAMPEP_0171603490 /NCGR_PEP_ID=MMETSP0990-20121206/6049_1 /TAXON_ID=483369 /ORGANISM="non described non described, Strain CCMP2098" /LENGTH=253 /DNA_ID=CAMNT_0012165847 /DNA_START=20 /DNA_END=781 /DNA_ORIENTATION=+
MSGIEISSGLKGDGPSNYTIIGGDCQVVNIKLAPGESCVCEPGVLMHMDPKLTPSTSYACSCRRYMSGEGQWRTIFTNNADEPAIVGLTPNRPAKVVPVDLAMLTAGGAEGLYCQQGAWMASAGEVVVSAGAECNPCKMCCAGQGAVKMYLRGTGTAFLEGHGTVMMKVLAAGEKLVVDQTAVLGWANTVDLTFRLNGGCCTCCCSGEGMFNAVLDGGSKGGVVILESMPFEKFRAAIVQPMPGQRGGKTNNV